MRKLALLAELVLLSSCSIVRSEADLPGLYELRYGDYSAALVIRGDGIYVETLTGKVGAAERVSHKWHLQRGCLLLEGFLIPEGSLPDSVLSSDSPRTSNGTRVSNICLEPERWPFGPVRLELNPDRPVFFTRVK